MKLSEAPKSQPLRVTNMNTANDADVIVRRLMELGFINGSLVEVRHQAPIMKDPIAVLVRGMVVALRRYEADLVTVEVMPKDS
jgi:Fe2+ transport system protein FeoA